MNATPGVTLGILAGGQGRRWGGRDKGLICHRGRPLIAHLCDTRAATLTEILICCRANPYLYQHYGDRILCESVADQGPCAGIVALLSACATDTLCIIPVDLIGAPQAVVSTLTEDWTENDRASVLVDESGRHSPCLRLHRDTLPDCIAYLSSGRRKITGLLARVNARSITVPSAWLQDADEPQSLSDQPLD